MAGRWPFCGHVLAPALFPSFSDVWVTSRMSSITWSVRAKPWIMVTWRSWCAWPGARAHAAPGGTSSWRARRYLVADVQCARRSRAFAASPSGIRPPGPADHAMPRTAAPRRQSRRKMRTVHGAAVPRGPARERAIWDAVSSDAREPPCADESLATVGMPRAEIVVIHAREVRSWMSA